jgi:hypothetical protein
MPALPAVPKTLKIALSVIDSVNRQLLTRFFLTYTGTSPTATEMNAFCASVSTSWNDNLSGLVNVARSLDEVQGVDLNSDTGAEGISTSTVAGARSGDETTAETSFVISYEIARRYRGGHARGYHPFGSMGDIINATTWGTTLQGEVASGWAAFMSENVGAGWSGAGTLHQANVSYYSGFTVVTSPTTGRARNVPTPRVAPRIDPVTAYAFRLPIGTQRRRMGL